MTVLALVTTKQLLDLLLVSIVSLALLALWYRQDRREKRRRVARKEKLAQYRLAEIRRRREYEEAMRYRGGVVR